MALLRTEYSAIVGREKEALGRYHALCIFEEGDLEEVEFWRARAKVFSQWGKEFKYRIEDAEREVVKRKKERRRGGYWEDLVGGMFQ